MLSSVVHPSTKLLASHGLLRDQRGEPVHFPVGLQQNQTIFLEHNDCIKSLFSYKERKKKNNKTVLQGISIPFYDLSDFLLRD